MRLSKHVTEGCLAAGYLAKRKDGNPVTAIEIAQWMGIRRDTVQALMRDLVRYQIVQSVRGRSGGYKLMKRSEPLTCLDIIETLEGHITADVPYFSEVQKDNCSECLVLLEKSCQRAVKQTRRILAEVTVEKLVEKIVPTDSSVTNKESTRGDVNHDVDQTPFSQNKSFTVGNDHVQQVAMQQSNKAHRRLS